MGNKKYPLKVLSILNYHLFGNDSSFSYYFPALLFEPFYLSMWCKNLVTHFLIINKDRIRPMWEESVVPHWVTSTVNYPLKSTTTTLQSPVTRDRRQLPRLVDPMQMNFLIFLMWKTPTLHVVVPLFYLLISPLP